MALPLDTSFGTDVIVRGERTEHVLSVQPSWVWWRDMPLTSILIALQSPSPELEVSLTHSFTYFLATLQYRSNMSAPSYYQPSNYPSSSNQAWNDQYSSNQLSYYQYSSNQLSNNQLSSGQSSSYQPSADQPSSYLEDRVPTDHERGRSAHSARGLRCIQEANAQTQEMKGPSKFPALQWVWVNNRTECVQVIPYENTCAHTKVNIGDETTYWDPQSQHT